MRTRDLARLYAQFTTRELADRLGRTPSTIRRWKRGKPPRGAEPQLQALRKLQVELGKQARTQKKLIRERTQSPKPPKKGTTRRKRDQKTTEGWEEGLLIDEWLTSEVVRRIDEWVRTRKHVYGVKNHMITVFTTQSTEDLITIGSDKGIPLGNEGSDFVVDVVISSGAQPNRTEALISILNQLKEVIARGNIIETWVTSVYIYAYNRRDEEGVKAFQREERRKR